MDMSNLKPAKAFALQNGIKAIVYSGPGEGKTPITASTSPRPVMLLCEAGTLSLRKSETPSYPAFTASAIDGFFQWFTQSNEAKNFDTLIIDSVSQMALTYLQFEAAKGSKGGNEGHGLKIYGAMATTVMKHMTSLYFMPMKHIIGIAKQEMVEITGINYRRPNFPGRVLPIDIPHLFDEILHLCKIPDGKGGETAAFRCQGNFETMARDRSGVLREFEPPNISHLIAKIMA